MREILFRGKRVDNGEWAEGFYYFSKWYLNGEFTGEITHYILPVGAQNAFRVDPDTVGQYTGLTDKNGKKIFEGDIVKFTDSRFRYSYVGVVCFYEGSFCIKFKGFRGEVFHRIGEKEKWQEMGASGTLTYQYEILGNIHDNPELLEEVQ